MGTLKPSHACPSANQCGVPGMVNAKLAGKAHEFDSGWVVKRGGLPGLGGTNLIVAYNSGH